MSHIIEDGKGTGKKAKVDADNKLATTAITRIAITFISESLGDAFRVTSTFLPITATRGCVFWFRNNSATKHFHVSTVRIGWNGGDTNHNRVVKAELRGGVSEPSANNQTAATLGLNSIAPKTPEMTAYEWDSVSTGMTVASEGVLSATAIFSQGLTVVDVEGAIIMGTNGALGIFFQAEETGLATITVEGYFEETNGGV